MHCLILISIYFLCKQSANTCASQVFRHGLNLLSQSVRQCVLWCVSNNQIRYIIFIVAVAKDVCNQFLQKNMLY